MIKNRGFTLIEVMIVLAIVAAVITLGMPRLFRNQDNLKTISRNFMSLSKSVRDKARLNNATYRLVIRIEPNNDAYWVERANGSQLIDLNLLTEEGQEQARERQKEEGAPPPAFQMDKSVMKKEKVLGGGLKFVSVETINMKAPVTQGEVGIHYFPEGFVEAAAVQISNATGSVWTMILNPLTGQVDIVQKAKGLKDAQR